MKRVIVYKDKSCDKCSKVFAPRSATQSWCDDCLTKECAQCGNAFHVGKKSKYDSSKFCSVKCRGLYRSAHYIGKNGANYINGNRTKVEITCDFCGSATLKEGQHIKKWTNNFCNRDCQANYYKDNRDMFSGENSPIYSQVTVICEWCEKEYKTYKSTTNVTRFCSKQCRHNWQSDMMKGDNHYNWKGGISEERSRDWVSREYRKWRNEVFERDKYTCQSCGDARGGNLNAHHIKSYKEYPDLRREITNGVTLCEPCHIEVHRKIKLDIQSELQL